jgi:hypothetical protein
MLGCAMLLPYVIAAGCGLSKNQQQKAVAAVTPWLQLIDAEQYDESWMRTVEYFKDTTTSNRWNELMRAYRKPLGKTVSRTMSSVERETSLPGAPDANYIVIKFDTVFEKKKKAVETVITVVGQNDQLGVTGYYVE